MLLDRTCKCICMENITDGLSSSDSVKLIRDLANVSCRLIVVAWMFVNIRILRVFQPTNS